jgi:hypothetical protein
MTKDQFDAACRAFCQRRPFRAFLIEFRSGTNCSSATLKGFAMRANCTSCVARMVGTWRGHDHGQWPLPRKLPQ